MTTITDERRKALDIAMAKIDKVYGEGSAFLLGKQKTKRIEAISTGSLRLDIDLGIGGLPQGRIVEVYGPESSGKTTLTLHAIASAQKKGQICVFIDAEHALDPEYARALGVDTDSLVVSQPDNGEQALEIADTFIRSGAVGLVVVDSVAALVPKAEIEGEMGDSHVGLQARMMSQALRKITGAAHEADCTVIFINQLREKIGGMSYGSNEVTTGGRALRFYASVRLDIRRIGAVKDGENVIGNQTKVKVAKNKVSPPFKVSLFDIIYGVGISRESEILDLGVETKVVQKAGAWYKDYETGGQIGQGKENARKFLVDNPEYANDLELKIMRALGFNPNGEVVEEANEIPSDDEIAATIEAEARGEALPQAAGF